MKIALGICVIAFGFAAPVLAQDKPPQPDPELFSSLIECPAIAEDLKRLACFDAATAALVKAKNSGEITVIDKQQMVKTRRSLFGFTLPKIALFGDTSSDKPEFRKIVTTIESATHAGSDRWAIRLPDGAVWQTTEPSAQTIRSGDPIEISKGLVGGYFIKVRKAVLIRARRVE